MKSQTNGKRWFSAFLLMLSVTLTAAITSMMILVNGTITLLGLQWLTHDHPEWAERQSLMQFVLFTIPLIMVIAEWFVWDFVRGQFTRERFDHL